MESRHFPGPRRKCRGDCVPVATRGFEDRVRSARDQVCTGSRRRDAGRTHLHCSCNARALRDSGPPFQISLRESKQVPGSIVWYSLWNRQERAGSTSLHRYSYWCIVLLSSLPARSVFFVNATNTTDHDLELTHIWFSTEPATHVTQPARPLPKRLRPQETWETWIPVHNLPPNTLDQAQFLARGRLSTGDVVKSPPNDTVPGEGLYYRSRHVWLMTVASLLNDQMADFTTLRAV